MVRIVFFIFCILTLLPNFILASSTDIKVGIYDFYLGENLNSVLKKCIDKKLYVTIISNSDISKEFSKYINFNTNFIMKGDTSIDIDKIDGKYLNLITNNKITTSATVNGKEINIKNNIPENGESLNENIASMVRNFPMPQGFYGGSISTYVPDILDKFGIKCNTEFIEDIFNKNFSQFIDAVSKNNNNKYDIKKIELQINNQLLNLFFINSPGATIDDILFFICLNVSKVSIDDNIKLKINRIFIDRYGNPEKLSNDISYYIVNNNTILHDKRFNNNIYYFINNSIMNYYIQSSSMLYNKYKESNENSLIEGM